jgi:hypothetical protein
MVKMQEAMNIAKEFIKNYGGHKTEFLLEEAFLYEDKGIWKVTYSFLDRNDHLSTLIESFGGYNKENRRIYRTVEIDNANGEVIGMKAGFSSNSGVTA